MNTNISTQINDNPAAAVAKEIVTKIQNAGHTAFFVGGGVRDLILGRNPDDFDIATSARPDQLQALFPGSLLVGAKFGVILVNRKNIAVEVATFREEGQYNDRRRPELVRFSTIEKDAQRRDFTANSLYYDPIADQIVDLVGGMQDIADRTLRTVGNSTNRFEEDALRVLRGVRFAACLDFTIDQGTWDALCNSSRYLAEISVERQREELVRGFTGEHPSRFLDLLNDSGILKMLLPEVDQLHGCEQPPAFHPEGDVYTHTRMLLENIKTCPSVELAFAALLHDIGKPATQTFEDRIRFNGHDKVGALMAQKICRRLRFSTAQTDTISTMVKRHMQFVNVPSMRKSTLNRFLAEPTIEDELELHRIDCLASHGNLDTYHFTQRRLEDFRGNDNLKGQLPKPFITGDDLIALGMSPSPEFAVILKQIFDDQLDGKLETREQALGEAEKHFIKNHQGH